MSLTGLAVGTTLKIVGPALAKTLLDSLGIGDKLTNKLLEQAIDVAADANPEGDGHQVLEQHTQKLAARLQTEMKPLFEREASNLDRGSQEAIFLAVAETLLQGSIRLDGLINIGLDAGHLTKQLLKANPRAIMGFSANEESLYRQAIAFASVSLIETVPQLEGFQLSMTQTMLRRVVPLCKGWRKRSHLLPSQFLSNLLIVVMNEIPNRSNVIV